MKKLEIKHLAAYLPYGLQMVNTKSGRIIDVRGLRDTVSTFYIEAIVKKGNTFEEADYQADIWPFKPLLIPLSEIPYEVFAKSLFVTGVELIDAIKDMTVPYWLIEKLLEKHFDVFGLLEAGLALNKLEYTTNH